MDEVFAVCTGDVPGRQFKNQRNQIFLIRNRKVVATHPEWKTLCSPTLLHRDGGYVLFFVDLEGYVNVTCSTDGHDWEWDEKTTNESTETEDQVFIKTPSLKRVSEQLQTEYAVTAYIWKNFVYLVVVSKNILPSFLTNTFTAAPVVMSSSRDCKSWSAFQPFEVWHADDPFIALNCGEYVLLGHHGAANLFGLITGRKIYLSASKETKNDQQPLTTHDFDPAVCVSTSNDWTTTLPFALQFYKGLIVLAFVREDTIHVATSNSRNGWKDCHKTQLQTQHGVSLCVIREKLILSFVAGIGILRKTGPFNFSESIDGGKTWSDPLPMLPKEIKVSTQPCSMVFDLQSISLPSSSSSRKVSNKLDQREREETSLPMQEYHFDVFLTHDWGEDQLERDNHQRVSEINRRLKLRGVRTWFDEERMTGAVDLRMTEGIDHSHFLLVFVTRRYQDKIKTDDDVNDNCKLEFKYGLVRKTAALVLPIVMEPCMHDSSQWRGPLGAYLGPQLHVRASGEITDQVVDDIINALAKKGFGKDSTKDLL
eukprot:Lithocolla_globosa_v1_NODE_2546_length_1958_cov_19.178140.p1 type:complete len:538 gc:universal NODE_2546_length_1958_cov_19.178140:1702-89(-)